MATEYRSYDVVSGKHGTPQEEWAPHAAQTEKTFEWWYLTNILKDESGDLLFQHVILFQFAGARYLKMAGLDPNAGNGFFRYTLALSRYSKNVRLLEGMFGKSEKAYDGDRNAVMFQANGFELDWQYQGDAMLIKAKAPREQYDLILIDKGDPVWHRDKLGIDGMIAESAADEPSFYYSIPWLEVEGSVTYVDDAGKQVITRVAGEGWCDRQWGDYLTMSWEWCSMRFLDGDRINLYAFPQTGHKVGTYRAKDGRVTYFDNFSVIQKSYFETPSGIWLASAWEYELPVKETKYSVRSASEKDLLVGGTNTLLESMGYIYDQKGKLVGYTANESMDIRTTGTGPYKNKI